MTYSRIFDRRLIGAPLPGLSTDETARTAPRLVPVAGAR